MNPITIQQLMDDNFFLPETILRAKTYIDRINIDLVNYGVDYLAKQPYSIIMRISEPGAYLYANNIAKYITYIYSNVGWNISCNVESTDYLSIEIKHPKLEIFK